MRPSIPLDLFRQFVFLFWSFSFVPGPGLIFGTWLLILTSRPALLSLLIVLVLRLGRGLGEQKLERESTWIRHDIRIQTAAQILSSQAFQEAEHDKCNSFR